MRKLLLGVICSLGSLCLAQWPDAPCDTPEEAKAIAEVETLGEAVTALRVTQRDGTRGWLVLVHMPDSDRGWRCIVDRDLAKVRSKDPIPNPPSRLPPRAARHRIFRNPLSAVDP